MGIKFSNLASTTLASSITSSATSITVADGSVFPALGSGDFFFASIDSPPNASEIVKVTAISGNSLTVVRGQDGTTATTHSSGEAFALRVVAAVLEDLRDNTDTTYTAGTNLSLSGTTFNLDTSTDIAFGDNDKAIFGSATDLSIYSDGTNSYIQEGAGTSGIRITTDNQFLIRKHDTENIAAFNVDGAVRLYHDNSQVFSTNSTGCAVTGTLTATAGAFESTGATEITLEDTDGGFAASKINVQNGGRDLKVTAPQDIIFNVGSSDAVTILNGGNVEIGTQATGTASSKQLLSLVNPHGNTGAAARLWLSGTNATTRGTYIEAEVQSAGNDHDLIFATSASGATPAERLRITSGGDVIAKTADARIGSDAGSVEYGTSAANSVRFYTNNLERFRLTSSGNVKIGTGTDRSNYLTASTANLQIDGGVVFEPGSGNDVEIFNYRSTDMLFGNSGAEDMRLDASGNLLVGKTAAGSNNVGAELRPQGYIFGTGDGINPLRLNRQTSDGMIADFQKDGTSVGSIGTVFGDLYVGTGDTNLRFDDSNDAITPRGSGGSARDAAVDLGSSSVRFKDLHLSGTAYIVGTTGRGLKISNATESYTNNVAVLDAQHSQGILQFKTAGSEAARIDKDGNLLVGKTSPSSATVGFQAGQDGFIAATRTSSEPLVLNRLTSDGAIATFRKDGTTVGSIGAYNSATGIISGSSASYTGIYLNTNKIEPAGNNFGSEIRADDTVDIGSSSYRFKDLYLSGTISSGAITSSSTISGSALTVTNSDVPTLTLYDNGNAGGGAAEARIKFQNTAGTAIAIGYTDDSTNDSDLIISTNAAGTYGGYLGLAAAAITDAQSDIILEPKTDVRIATGGLKIGTTTVIDSNRSLTNIADLAIQAGNGQGVGFWGSGMGGSYRIYMSAQSSSTYGGRVTGETSSDYNMYFRMSTGTNRGFVFRNTADNYFAINPDAVRSEVPLAVQYTGSKANDAAIYVNNDINDWGMKIVKNSGDNYGILVQSNGGDAMRIANSAGAAKIQLSGGGSITATGDINLNGGNLTRNAHHTGHLEGSYNSVGSNNAKSNPIYTIGSGYNPSDASLGNMYGIGFSKKGNATFLGDFREPGWGLYAAYNGSANIFLNAQTGVVASTDGYDVGNVNVIDSSRNLTNITGAAISHSTDNGFQITASDTVAGQSFNAAKIDYNISGNTTFSGDYTHIGMFLDVDSSASGGGTAQEHRVYGYYADVRASGDSDQLYGAYFISRADNFGAGNTITNIRGAYNQGTAHQDAGVASGTYGAYNLAQNYATGSGQSTNLYGAYNLAQALSASSYTGANYYGSYNITQVTTSQTADIAKVHGVYGEIQLDDDAAADHAITITNAYVFRAEYDENDADNSYTVNTGYLYYGNYAGALPTTAYGVYIADAVDNYFSGNVRTASNFQIDSTTVIDSSRNLKNINSVEIGAKVTLQESTDRADLLQITSTTGGWAGLQIRNSSNEGRWSFMTDGNMAGIYDDENGAWHIEFAELGATSISYASSVKLTTRTDGVLITGSAYLNDTNTRISEGSGNALRVTTHGGYVDVGPMSTSYSHFQTDRASFYFNKRLTVDEGIVQSYDEDLRLRRVNSADQVTIGNGTVEFTASDIYIPNKIVHTGDTNTYMQFHAADQWRVVTGGSERLEVNGGDVTVASTLNVRQALDLADNDILRLGSGDDAELFCNGSHLYLDLNSGIGNFYIRDGTTTRYTFDDNGSFTATGNITAYSDRRVKAQFEPITDALAKVQQLHGQTYIRTDMDDANRRYAGLIAQDVEAVLPEAVSEVEDHLTLDYSGTIGLLVEAIKELKQEVNDLKIQLKEK